MIELVRLFAPLPRQLDDDAFGLIYEDFLSNFASQEGRLGGEFFTPYSIVRLIVEVIEPFHGRVLDPACGSGGMFVQCAKFVGRHHNSATRELSIFGTEKTEETVPLAKMNLALHGLSGDIRLANSYYEDPHKAVGSFDFVMANPPFNVDKVDKAKLAAPDRFPFGLPKPDNVNYLWIQTFYSALNRTGRAGFVMANSAGDAGHSERDIRQKLVESGAIDVMIAIGTNFFYTVTLPATLWFLDRGKAGTEREDQVLFGGTAGGPGGSQRRGVGDLRPAHQARSRAHAGGDRGRQGKREEGTPSPARQARHRLAPQGVFDAKVQAVYDHVLASYGDDGSSVYAEPTSADELRADISFPSGTIEIERISEAVVTRLRTDPAFAARLAAELAQPVVQP